MTTVAASSTNGGQRKKRLSFQCLICLCTFTDTEHASSGTTNCNHSLCEDCVRQYFSSALKDNRSTTYELIQCPYPACTEYYSVNAVLEKFFTKFEANQWWDDAIKSKAYIPNKVTCPMADCGAVFDVDVTYTRQCTFSECEVCHRGFCLACQTTWHPGKVKIFDDREELKQTLKRAKKNSWCRCPRCGQLVERESGCSHMVCHCGTYFCYHCGRETFDCQDSCAYWSTEKLEQVRNPMFM